MENRRSASGGGRTAAAIGQIKVPLWERIAIFAFGATFVTALLVRAVVFPEPTPFQYTVFRIVLALAAAGVAAFVPGFLEVRCKTIVRAGGALAVFVIVYFFSPAGLVVTPRHSVGNVTGAGNIITQGQEGGTNTIVNQAVELVFQSAQLKQEVWTEIEMDVPAGVADYLLLLFRSNVGRISGMVRIKGSQDVSPFYTTVNNTVPVAVRNLWVPAEGQYKVPTIMEFSITEKPTPDASLSIYTAGWVDSQGREPH
jgi:hypothetical protein